MAISHDLQDYYEREAEQAETAAWFECDEYKHWTVEELEAFNRMQQEIKKETPEAGRQDEGSGNQGT